MSKHLVAWNKPVPVTVGKSKLSLEGEMLYTSKCGRFEIQKVKYASGRGNFNNVGYKLRVVATGKAQNADSLADAKLLADWEIDPDFDPEA